MKLERRSTYFSLFILSASLALTACGSERSNSDNIPADVLTRCVRAPSYESGMALSKLVDVLTAKGAKITWEKTDSGYILRTVQIDPLIKETKSFDFEITLRAGSYNDPNFPDCGPHRAEIKRAATPVGVIDGIMLDTFIAQLAEAAGMQQPDVQSFSQMNSSAEKDEAVIVDADAAPTSTNQIPNSGNATGQCDVKIGGKTVMTGSCSGAFHEDSVVLGAEHGGCHVDLRWKGNRAQAYVYSYRDVCFYPGTEETIDQDIDLGLVSQDGRCWKNDQVNVCLN